jgi:chlorite dismutase
VRNLTLSLTSKLNSSNRSLNALNSHLQNTKEELRKLEAQERMNNGGNSDSMNQQQNQVSAEEVTGAERKFKLYFQAYLLSKKYNGDIDKISKEGGKDLVKLKILANNLLGAGREWRTLFTNGKSLLDDQHQKVFALQKAYRNATPQQDTGSSKSTKRLATLRKEIEQLEQTIIPKRRENTDYQLQKNDIDFITMNLTDAANDDNKVILAVNQISDSDSSSDSHWWTGNYTRVYYQDRSGVLYFGGYGDAEAETEEIKPGNGSILYLHQSDDSDSVDERTRTLSESEASYFGNYSYTAWGTWSDTNATRKIYTSHWVVTDYTPDIDMPRQGHATYEGELAGGQWTIGQTGYNSVNGNITLNADFGTNTISGNINVKNASTGSTWGTASISNGTITNTELDGQLVGAGISTTEDWHSQISGSFGGPQASEAGGMWAITKGTGANGDERAVGVFRAKKQ